MGGLIKFVIGLNILPMKKMVFTDSINHIFGKIRSDSYNSLPITKY